MLDKKKTQSRLLNEKEIPGTNPAAYKRGWENGVNYGINKAIFTVRYSGDDEFKYILSFTTESRDASLTSEDLFANQLLALWTAYCLHENRTCDTGRYDSELLQIWELLEDDDKPEIYYGTFDKFDLFMGQYLS